VALYDPDGLFTISALCKLEDIDVPVITSLNTNFQALQLHIQSAHACTDPISLLKAWLFHGVSSYLSPSWKNLLQIIRDLNLEELAKRMETHLSGGTRQDNQCSDSGMSEAEFKTDNEAESESEGLLIFNIIIIIIAMSVFIIIL
jgi:hypothetical protein